MYSPDAEGRVEIRKYLAFLRRRWWLLLFGPVLAGFAAVMITGRMAKTYSATSQVLVNKTTAPGSQEYYDALLSQRGHTEATLTAEHLATIRSLVPR